MAFTLLESMICDVSFCGLKEEGDDVKLDAKFVHIPAFI